MVNINPIKTKDTGIYEDYFLPKNLGEHTLYFKTKTSLDKLGWKLDLKHMASFNGISISFKTDSNGDIIKCEIGKFSEIITKKFSLVSVAGRIRNGGTGDPALVDYSVTFLDENDVEIDYFPIRSDKTNPVSFYTKIIFKF